MYCLRDLIDKHHWPDASILHRHLLGQDNKVVSTHGRQLDNKCVFVVVGSVLFVVGDQLFGVLLSAQHLVLYKVGESLSMRSVLKLEVEALSMVFVSDVSTLFGSIVLEDKLLKEEESSLVVNLLTDLHLRLPEMWRVGLFAFITLQVGYDELHDEGLLEESAVEHFLLHGNLNLESSRMRLSPNKTGIYHLNAFEALDVLQTKRQKLSRFKFTLNPWWALVAIALSAMLELHGL